MKFWKISYDFSSYTFKRRRFAQFQDMESQETENFKNCNSAPKLVFQKTFINNGEDKKLSMQLLFYGSLCTPAHLLLIITLA